MMTEKNVFLKLFKYFKTEAARGRPFCSLNNPQQRTVHALKLALAHVQTISTNSDGKSAWPWPFPPLG